MAVIRRLVMSQDELIRLLWQTPSPTGVLHGQALDAWRDWCKEFDAREGKPVDNAYTL